MPLARIITDDAEEALELAMQLRARGFQVETVASDHIAATPADLEIELDSCDAESVLARIMSASGDEDSFVFVAPGSLDQSNVPRTDRVPNSPAQRRESKLLKRNEEVSLPRVTLPAATFPDVVLAEAAMNLNREIAEPVQSSEPMLDFDAPPIEIRIQESAEAAPDLPARVAEPDETVEAPVAQPETPSVHADAVTDIEACQPANPPVAVPFSVNDVPASVPVPMQTAQGTPVVARETPSAILEVPVAADRSIGPANPPTAVPLRRSTIAVSNSRRRDALFWRVAIPAAALATLVVLAGSVWQRHQPPTGTLPTAPSQQIPFQAPVQNASAAPVSAPSATQTAKVAEVPPAAVSGAGSAPSQPSIKPQAASPTPGSPAPKTASASKASTKKAKTAAQHHATTHAHDSGLVARDTVVYFDKKPGSASGTSNSSSK